MYARLIQFSSDPGKRSEVEAIADKAFAIAKQQQGFISIHFIISADESTYGSFSLWESKNDADTGGESIREQVSAALKEVATAPPLVDMYEIYKPGG